MHWRRTPESPMAGVGEFGGPGARTPDMPGAPRILTSGVGLAIDTDAANIRARHLGYHTTFIVGWILPKWDPGIHVTAV